MQDGFYISLVGTGIVLVVLALVAVAIMLLNRLDSMFPAEAAPANGMTPARPARRPTAPSAPAPRPADPGAQTAAAIAVALALAELEGAPRRSAPRPQKVNGNNDSSWVSAGRTRQMRGWTPNAGRGRQR